MKRFLLICLVVFPALMVFAQSSGGEIKRSRLNTVNGFHFNSSGNGWGYGSYRWQDHTIRPVLGK